MRLSGTEHYGGILKIMEFKEILLAGLSSVGGALLTGGIFIGIVKTRLNGHTEAISMLQQETVKKETFALFQEEIKLSRLENREDHKAIQTSLNALRAEILKI